MTDYTTPTARHLQPERGPLGTASARQPSHRGLTSFMFAYHGDSMSPVLREADILEVTPYGARPVRRGDVVAFHSPETGKSIIHRVVAEEGDHVRTRGDNCLRPDPWRIPCADIQGRAFAVWRESKRRSLHGGTPGHITACMAYAGYTAFRMLRPVLRPPYRYIVRSGLLRKLLPHRFRPRIVTFRSGADAVYHRVLMGNRIVAWEAKATGQWRIRFPFALFIDRSILSRPAPVPEEPAVSAPCRRPLPSPRNSLATRLSPEADFLVAACATVVNPVEADDLRDMVGPNLDWRRLVELASAHGTIGFLERALRAHPTERLPQDARLLLKQAALANTANNLRLIEEMRRACEVLAAHDIRGIPIKGPALSATAFGDPCLRVSCDVDILLRRDEMMRARDVMTGAGYRLTLDVPASAEDAYLRERGEYILIHPGTNVQVELLTQVVPRSFACRLDYDEMRNRATTTRLMGSTFPSLRVDDHLLIAITHGTKHMWSRLGWILDVAGLMQQGSGMDWNLVHRTARSIGGERMLLLAADLASQLCGLPPPEPLAPLIVEDIAVWRLSEHLLTGLFSGLTEPHMMGERIRMHMAMRERPRDRFRYLALLALTPSYSDWKTVALPRNTVFLYYLLRPVRLLASWILASRHPTKAKAPEGR